MLFLLSVSVMTVYAPLCASDLMETTAFEGTELSIDQKVFVSKLNDENRKIFINLENEQRESILTAAKNGLEPDKAVQHLVEPMNIENCAIDMMT